MRWGKSLRQIRGTLYVTYMASNHFGQNATTVFKTCLLAEGTGKGKGLQGAGQEFEGALPSFFVFYLSVCVTQVPKPPARLLTMRTLHQWKPYRP